MNLDDVDESAEIFFEVLGHHLQRYLLSNQTLPPEQWKAKHIAYREEMFRWWVQYGRQRGLHCKVIRDENSKEIAGFIVWQDSLTVDSASKTEEEGGGFPGLPPEADAEAWKALGNDYDKFLKDEYPNQTVATIHVLGIRSKYRNRGLGGQLVTAFLDSIHGQAVFIVSQPVAVSLYQ